MGVAGVVNDAGDHAGTGEPGVCPDMLINAERINASEPCGPVDPEPRLGFDAVPQDRQDTPSWWARAETEVSYF